MKKYLITLLFVLFSHAGYAKAQTIEEQDKSLADMQRQTAELEDIVFRRYIMLKKKQLNGQELQQQEKEDIKDLEILFLSELLEQEDLLYLVEYPDFQGLLVYVMAKREQKLEILTLRLSL